MSFKKSFKSYTKLLLIILSGYTFILAGLWVLAVQLSNEIERFTSHTNKLYQHPFQVNSAAQIARQSMSTLRAEALYAVIDQSKIKRETYSQQSQANQLVLDNSLKIIEDNFLGDISRIKESIVIAQTLQKTRVEIINLLIDGQTIEAEQLIKVQSTPLYNDFFKHMDYVIEFSSNKASDLVLQTHEIGNESFNKLWLFFIIFAAFTLCAGSITVTIVLRNLYNRDKSLNEASENLRIAATAFEAQEGMIVTDASNKILRVNSSFSKITGYAADEVIGKTPSILASGKHDSAFYAAMWNSITHRDYWEGEVWNKRKSGELYPQKLTITAVKDVDSIVTTYVGTMSDVTSSKQAEKEIADLAYYDPLTQLPNRRLLIDRLHHALLRYARNENEGALLFLDLDHFKTLNDTLGHDMGDLLLNQVAERLVSCIRESDTVSRFGGDEFVILLESLSEDPSIATTQVENIANKILTSINAQYNIAGLNYKISTSIGITLFSGKLASVEELLKQADIALYQAKDDGRNKMRFFDPQMQKKISARAKLEEELHHAIERQQFELYYQVQVDNKNMPLGVEALLRWNHPTRGLVPPLEFIPIAEQNGTIISIGQWVIHTACAQLKEWQGNKLTESLTLAINVSAKQFHQSNFVDTIEVALGLYEVQPKLLKIELTESMLLKDINETIAKMQELSQLGIQFSLDDFGTGYSSLQYLKQLPLHQLKIDKSFVDGLGEDGRDQEIVRTIIAMSHSLGLSVIAEGVETEKQLLALSIEGCKHYQGYLFGKPIKIADFEKLFYSPK